MRLTINFDGGQVGRERLNKFEKKFEPADTVFIEDDKLIAVWEEPKDTTILGIATLFLDETDAVNVERLQ